MTSHRRMPARRLAALRGDVRDGVTKFLSCAAVRALLDDRDWHRARVPVTADMIRRRRVTYEQVEAWARRTDRYDQLFQGCTLAKPTWAERDAAENGGRQMASYVEVLIAQASLLWGLVPLDVLDEIAATEIDP